MQDLQDLCKTSLRLNFSVVILPCFISVVILPCFISVVILPCFISVVIF